MQHGCNTNPVRLALFRRAQGSHSVSQLPHMLSPALMLS